MLAWTVPYALARHTYPIPTFYSEFATLALYLLMAFACVSLVFVERRKSTLQIARIAWMPAAFCLLLLAQMMLLPLSQPSMSVLAIGFLSAVFITIQTGFWIAQLGLTEKIIRWLAYALLAGGLFAVFCQLIQVCRLENQFTSFVLPYYEESGRRLFGNMAQANHLSTYLSFALAAALFLRQAQRLPLSLWMLLSAALIAGQALTASRMAWLQFAVIVIGGVLMERVEKQRTQAQLKAPTDKNLPQHPKRLLNHVFSSHSMRNWLVPVLLILIFISVNWAVRVADEVFQLQLAKAAAERFQDAGQISPRLALWHYGWDMFKAHPWLGVGWGEFPSYQYALLDKLGTVEIANSAHNVLLDLLAKTGILGAGLVVVSLVFWLWRTAIVGQTSKDVTRLFCLMLLAVLAVHALLEYPQQYLFFLLPAAFLLGVLETQTIGRGSSIVFKASYWVLTIVSLAMLYPVWRDYQRAETLYYAKQPQQQYQANPAWLFSAWGQYAMASLLPLNEKMLAAKLAMHEQALTLLPGQAMLRRYAVLLALAGREDEALVVVRRLKLFSMSLRNWPTELAGLYALCDAQGTTLASFKKRLVQNYGAVAQTDTEDD